MHLLMDSSERSRHQKNRGWFYILKEKDPASLKHLRKSRGGGVWIRYNEAEQFMKLRGQAFRKICHCLRAFQQKSENSYLNHGKYTEMAVSKIDALLGSVNSP